MFRFAQGGSFRTGIMAEAGEEAVMPLRRGPGGRLGVEAVGGQAKGNVSVVIEGSTVVLQDSQATPEELERVLDERDREMERRIFRQITETNNQNPRWLHT